MALADSTGGTSVAASPEAPKLAGLSGSSMWTFDSGRVAIICPEAPESAQSSLADEKHPNYTRLYRYADLDALLELWGHVRAINPAVQVVHRLPSEVTADDLSGHLVLIGGIGWNEVTKRLMKTLRELPVSQVEVKDLETDEIFRTSGDDGREYRPVWEESAEDTRELIEDVALLARMRNPFNHSRTITICNGIHSRGVLGSVRTLTDTAVRERNEAVLSSRFPGGLFAVLLRVPVLSGEVISPDLEIAANRLYEWSPSSEATAE